MTGVTIALQLQLLTYESELIKFKKNTSVEYQFYYAMSILSMAAVTIQIIFKNKTAGISLHYSTFCLEVSHQFWHRLTKYCMSLFKSDSSPSLHMVKSQLETWSSPHSDSTSSTPTVKLKPL